jgi:sugar-phosphatase
VIDVELAARGLLFDNDGVLVDSDTSVRSSWSRWAVDHDLDPTAVLAAVPGRRAADTVALFVAPDDVPTSVEEVTRYELEDADATVAVPGAVDLVGQLDDVPWAVVTSGVRPLASARLRAAGVRLPWVVVTAEDVRAGKPDPEGYLRAAELLGVDPAACLVVEDADAGITAGRAAGARVAALKGLHADLDIADLGELAALLLAGGA